MSMKILLLLVLITWYQICVSGQRCSSPKVSRTRPAFIYRTSPTIKVKVVSCLYNDGNLQNNYYDVSSNCINASTTGIFIDKYGETHFVNRAGSVVTIEYYDANADPLKNSLWLRSGKKCRYDTGFCYDPKYALSYAVTWHVAPIPKERCPTDLEQIFFGNVDFWTFTEEKRSYLFYSVPLADKSFALSLSNSSLCHNKQVWNADERGYIVSYTSLLPIVRATPVLDEELFPPLKSKASVSEAIIRDCNLKSHTLDFDAHIDADYLVNSENIKTILKLYQKNIDKNEQSIVNLAKAIKDIENSPKSSSSNNQASQLEQELNNLKASRNTMLIDINKLFDKIKKLETIESDVLSEMSNLVTNINKLGNSVKQLETNNKNYEEISLKSLQKNIEQTFLNFHKNISAVTNVQIHNLQSRIENSVVSKLSPVFDSVNQASIICLNTVKNLKQDNEISIKNLENAITKTGLSVEKTVEVYVNKAFVNINDTINDKLIPIKNSLIQKCDNCSNEVAKLQNRVVNSINTVEQELQQCTLKQKHIIDDINNVNTSLVKRLTFSENNLMYLINLVDTHKRSSETVKNATDLLLRDIINNITHTHLLLNTSIENNSVNKQMNIIFNSLNDKINQCSKNVATLKNDIVQTAVGLKQEITQSGTDAYRNITNLNTVFSSQIDNANSKTKSLENELKQFKINVGINQNTNVLNFNRVRQEISALNRSTSDAVSKSEAKILKQIIPLLKPSLINENVTKHLDILNKSLTREIKSCQYQIKVLENNVDDCKRTSDLKTNAAEAKIKDIQKDITNTHTILTNLPKRVEDTVFNRIHPTLKATLDKSENYEKQVNDLKEEIKELKEESLRLRKSNAQIKKTLQKFFPNEMST